MNIQKKVVVFLLLLSVIFSKKLYTLNKAKNFLLNFKNTPKRQLDIPKKLFKNPFHENLWAGFIQNKNPQKALQILGKLIKTNKYAYKHLIVLLHKTRQNRKIVEMIPILKTAFPEAFQNIPDVGFMVAYALVRNNIMLNNMMMPIVYNPKAMDILIPLNNKFPDHQKIATLTATLYDLNKEIKSALAVSEKYLNSSATKVTDFLEYFKNSTRRLKIGEQKKALISIEKCLEIQPRFVNAWIFAASLKDKMGKTEEAMNDCKKALDLAGPNKALALLLIKLFFKFKKVQHRLNEFVMNKQCFNKALQLFNTKQNNKALEYINKCLSTKLKNNTQKNILRVKASP